MTYDEAISTLKKHLNKLFLYDTDFSVWLSTTIEYVHEIFSFLSPQYSSATGLKNEFDIAKITDKSQALTITYANKANQLLKNFIEQLEDKKKQAIQKQNFETEKVQDEEIKFAQKYNTLLPLYENIQKENSRLKDEVKNLIEKLTPKKISFGSENGIYKIKHDIFWTVLSLLLGGFFYFGYYVGTTKYDRDKITLDETNHSLQDTIKNRDNKIIYLRHNSDSALDILGHMPYNEMTLDTASYRKVQTTIENAGGALYLNK